MTTEPGHAGLQQHRHAFQCRHGRAGIACLQEFSVKEALESGELRAVLTQEVTRTIHFSVLWPPNRFITPTLRCFVDFISLHI
ncbi:LysR substrate-binding domain-containing protein [Pseudomonas sp. NFACC13-1]|uniref:LysR substrate-binding domain-containing protein n=1 Tax=Pseudomonas sp. NFACC13-1 TaxID=1566245 RepID=UPI00210B03A9|nr:LysR substrate-binding domain-containing protein [Pseudomonas sp. NFACC13-1]